MPSCYVYIRNQTNWEYTGVSEQEKNTGFRRVGITFSHFPVVALHALHPHVIPHSHPCRRTRYYRSTKHIDTNQEYNEPKTNKT